MLVPRLLDNNGHTVLAQAFYVTKQIFPNTNVGWAVVHDLFEGWSENNYKEIEKGWIIQADSLRELAERTGIDSSGLAETVERYNGHCSAANDSQFGRPAKTMQPIQTPPYYALELALSVINTQGGPVHNARAQVLDVDERPIPRLYAAGELGSFFGHLYQGGNNFPEALAFGRIAGKDSASLTSWE